MATELERITKSLGKTFNKGPWYGPSLMDILGQVNHENMNARVGKSHSIVELLLHMVSWRRFVTRRLQGDNNFQVSEEKNFPSAVSITWQDALSQLEKSQEELTAAAATFPEGRLGELVPSITGKYTYYTLLHGIEQHDIYHIGQIQLILRSLA